VTRCPVPPVSRLVNRRTLPALPLKSSGDLSCITFLHASVIVNGCNPFSTDIARSHLPMCTLESWRLWPIGSANGQPSYRRLLHSVATVWKFWKRYSFSKADAAALHGQPQSVQILPATAHSHQQKNKDDRPLARHDLWCHASLIGV